MNKAYQCITLRYNTGLKFQTIFLEQQHFNIILDLLDNHHCNIGWPVQAGMHLVQCENTKKITPILFALENFIKGASNKKHRYPNLWIGALRSLWIEMENHNTFLCHVNDKGLLNFAVHICKQLHQQVKQNSLMWGKMPLMNLFHLWFAYIRGWHIPGLSKVASCLWKSPPTWLVSAGYSVWHFFTDSVFWIKYPWTGRLLSQLSAVYFKTFWQPWNTHINHTYLLCTEQHMGLKVQSCTMLDIKVSKPGVPVQEDCVQIFCLEQNHFYLNNWAIPIQLLDEVP